MSRWKSALALIALVAFSAAFLNTDGGEAGHEAWTPTWSANVANTDPGATSDININFGVAGGYNLGGVVLFTPKEYVVPAATDLPLGAKIARLDSRPYLGLLNGPCVPFIPVGFDFINASVDITNTIDPKPSSETDSLAPIAADTDGNGIQDGADKYPSYLNTVFEGQKPHARLFGSNYIQSASTTVILNFVIFPPGTKPNRFSPDLDQSLGYPAVAVLQNPEAPVSPPGTITDFCSPLETTSTVYGLSQDNPNTGADESGQVVRKNPADGVYNLVMYARSQRDVDHDGLENSFDSCPLVGPNVEDPRKSPAEGGDPDKPQPDGIDSVCDPDPATRCGPGLPGATPPNDVKDCDGDGFYNRADNCALLPNADQLDLDRDALGDACDPTNPNGVVGPATADGFFAERCMVTEITIGAGGPKPSLAVPPCGSIPTEVNLPGEPSSGDASVGGGDAGSGAPGTTAGGTRAGTGAGGAGAGGPGGPASGIGSLSPVASTIPAWALIASALGGAGLVGSLGMLASRAFRRRRL